MAAITAFHVLDVGQQTDNARVPPELFNQALPTPYQAEDTGYVSGTLPFTGGPPGSTVPAATITAFELHSFADDYYDRIHIVPNPLSMGNLLSSQVREVEVWNAYNTPQLLTSITPVDDEGVTLVDLESRPATFGGLESRLYTATITTDGPAEVDAYFTFDFPGEDPVFHVTGTRVLVFGWKPNWRVPVTEKLSWLTDLFESENGTEQTVALRSKPRRGLEYLITLDRHDRRVFETLLWRWQNAVFALPIWIDKQTLTTAFTTGNDTFYCETTGSDFYPGGLAVVIGDETQSFEILSVASDHIVSVKPVIGSFPIGTPIYPAKRARLDDTQQIGRYTDTVIEASLQWTYIDNESAIAAAELSGTTYRSYPVLERKPNWRSNLTAEYARRLDILDNTTGVVAYDDITGRPTTLHGMLWTIKGKAEIVDFIEWLYARAGRLNPIWVPTWTDDMRVAETYYVDATDLKIENIGYTRFLIQDIGRRDIQITMYDGTVYRRRIVSSVEQDVDVEVLTLDSGIGAEKAIAEFRNIEFLELCRIESDTIEIQWLTNDVIEVRHNFRGTAHDL